MFMKQGGKSKRCSHSASRVVANVRGSWTAVVVVGDAERYLHGRLLPRFITGD